MAFSHVPVTTGTAADTPTCLIEAADNTATASKRVGEPIHQATANNKGAISQASIMAVTISHEKAAQEMDTGKKSRRSLKPLARIFPYIRQYPRSVAGALIALVTAAVTTLILPVAVRSLLDNGLTIADSGFIDTSFAALMLLAAVLAVASAARYYFVITLGERIVADLRRDVFAHVTRLSPAFFDQVQSGEIVSRLTADTTQVKSAVGATASIALRNLILVIGAVAMMVITSPKLSALVLAAIPLVVLPLVAFGRSVRRRSRRAQDELALATAYAGEKIAAVRTVQAFTHEGPAIQHYSTAVDDAYDAARQSILSRSILTAFAIFIVFSSVVAVLWFGSHDVMSGRMSAGTLGQFLIYAVVAAGSLGALSEVWAELAQAAGAAERLVELLNEESAVTSPLKPVALNKVEGRVEFSHVDFAYPTRPDSQALHDMSFVVEPGKTVAIVGASGAGKSTLIGLLLRYYDPQHGTIMLDGIDLRALSLDDLRGNIALVPQDVTIFASSIRENIAFGRPDATDAEIIAAAQSAQAHEFIMALEGGYEAQVGERGVMLSGGQRQRLAIARALLRDAPVLLLDEATSALDAQSEMLVQKALEHLMQGRTTLVIAHRLATVLKADHILVMDQGRIVEQGTHATLSNQAGGIYARLANLQFQQTH
ncbi:Multidrug resistance ABC transporter ATP-binding/permease protein BmrA [Pseudochrobactrum sp. MP213Fo]